MGNLADIELQRREPPQISNPPATTAGVYLCRRFCINPAVADLVASLAGLGPDRRAA
jgi:hypothetical protein